MLYVCSLHRGGPGGGWESRESAGCLFTCRHAHACGRCCMQGMMSSNYTWPAGAPYPIIPMLLAAAAFTRPTYLRPPLYLACTYIPRRPFHASCRKAPPPTHTGGPVGLDGPAVISRAPTYCIQALELGNQPTFDSRVTTPTNSHAHLHCTRTHLQPSGQMVGCLPWT